MFNLVFYKDKNGVSEIINYLDRLKEESSTSKTSRINREKILAYLSVLVDSGTRIGVPYVKHIEGNIWELRPLKNRIFFFYWKNNTFVLLHYYIKKSQKMPVQELLKAKNNLKDYIERNSVK